MNKNLVLVSKKPIVIQIFTLVCKKLNISLEVLHDAQIDHKVDMIVLDNEFINDRFNIIKTYAKIIGAISKEELPFEFANDFIVPMPFLPSVLQEILETQIEILNKRINSKTYVSNVEVEDDDYEDEFAINTMQKDDPSISVDYLESLADDIADDMREEVDDSVVSRSSVNHGGILDRNELSMIESIMGEQAEFNTQNDFIDVDEESDDQWIDLSSIIDQAIDEVNTVDHIYNKTDNNPIKLLLNNYELDELKPLLSMLDQEIIDSLADGNEVSVLLKLDSNDK
ncbi:MAG: hypothetical protein K8R39_04865 [Arcobacteraceae bacterium]|nr:hypothetical protein [Arcobacteraceae bacterium]